MVTEIKSSYISTYNLLLWRRMLYMFTWERVWTIVSPVGCFRSGVEQIVFGIEIKCPMPGKLYTTRIQQNIPHYYAPRLLAKCMHPCKRNAVFSYSEKSMSVLKAMYTFYEQLWEKIVSEIKARRLCLLNKA